MTGGGVLGFWVEGFRAQGMQGILVFGIAFRVGLGDWVKRFKRSGLEVRV